MTSELSKKAANKIETLCQAGCLQVNQLLEKAKTGNVIEELAGFNGTEIKLIIAELSQIMSVYDAEDKDD